MKTLGELLHSHCRPQSSGALTATEASMQLRVLPDWTLEDSTIVRRFGFSDYRETIAFVNALAWVVQAEDHHPDLVVGYNRCEVRFSTHSVGGLSINDFICAAKADALYVQRGAAPAA